ncbi:MAG: segregation/condensation protein A [Taibaiella sp.]|nr:segregation/condensation protein A [Taibaiella sp.]
MSVSYQIKLPQFEGPFDLLLFFIERDELDIYNIPITTITNEFLAYIKKLEVLNIELASEFILFVSTLMRIKARMLLPRKEKDEHGNEIDPRQELVDKILEYKRYKEVSELMTAMEADRLMQQKRGNISTELHVLGESYSEGTEIQAVTMYKLLEAYKKAIKRFNERMHKPQHVVVKYNYSLDGQRTFLLTHLKEQKRIPFELLFESCENRIHAIFTFLAMLELIQQRFLTILTGIGRNNFILEWNNEETMTVGAENTEATTIAIEDTPVDDTVEPESPAVAPDENPAQ